MCLAYAPRSLPFNHANSSIPERLQLQENFITMTRFDVHTMNFRFPFQFQQFRTGEKIVQSRGERVYTVSG